MQCLFDMERLNDKDIAQLVANCANADEFVKRAGEVINLPNSKLYDIYENERYKLDIQLAWEKLDTIEPLLKQRADCQKLYYECWIDLHDNWCGLYRSSLRFLNDAQIIEVCAKYLNEQERFYNSGEYYNMLDNMISNAKWENQ